MVFPCHVYFVFLLLCPVLNCVPLDLTAASQEQTALSPLFQGGKHKVPHGKIKRNVMLTSSQHRILAQSIGKHQIPFMQGRMLVHHSYLK